MTYTKFQQKLGCSSVSPGPPLPAFALSLRMLLTLRPSPLKFSERLSGLRTRSLSRAVRTVYLTEAGQLFLLTNAISPSAAVVGRAGWPLLAVSSYGGGRTGSHDWNLSRHPVRSPPVAPRPHPPQASPRTSGWMVLPC